MSGNDNVMSGNDDEMSGNDQKLTGNDRTSRRRGSSRRRRHRWRTAGCPHRDVYRPSSPRHTPLSPHLLEAPSDNRGWKNRVENSSFTHLQSNKANL